MKLRSTLGAGLATAAVAATLSCLGAPALAVTGTAPTAWDTELPGTALDVALSADGGTTVVLIDGGYDDDGNALPDELQWHDASTGAQTASLTLPATDAAALAVVADGTVVVTGYDEGSAGLWTVAPGADVAVTTDLAENGSASAVAIDGDVALVGGYDDNGTELWSVPLGDPGAATATTLSDESIESASVSGVAIEADGTAAVAVSGYDTATEGPASALWQVSDPASATAAATIAVSWSDGVAGVAAADGLVQVGANDADGEAHLLTYRTADHATTDRDLGLTFAGAVTVAADRVVVSTGSGDAVVPASGTASYTTDEPAPTLQLAAGSADKLIVGSARAIGITSFDVTLDDGGPSVFDVTSPVAPEPHVAVHGSAADVSWAYIDASETPAIAGNASIDTYSVTATDTTSGTVLPTVTEPWEDAFDGEGITVTVPGLVAGHHYTFAATQAGDLYTSAAGTADATVALPATAKPSKINVTGSPAVGTRLTIRTTGSWAKGARLSYAWYAGTRKVGTAATYTPATADVGARIKVAVTGTLAGHTASTVTSAAVGPVTKPVYVVRSRPTITGTAAVGKTLTAHISGLPKNATVRYQWAENRGQSGGPVGGRTSSPRWKVPASVRGARLEVIVFVTVPGYQTGSAMSRLTAVVK